MHPIARTNGKLPAGSQGAANCQEPEGSLVAQRYVKAAKEFGKIAGNQATTLVGNNS
jgi:hypothetical protein